MQTDRQRLAEVIFKAVVALPSGERAADVERRCGDDTLLMEEVAGLLEFAAEDEGPLDAGAATVRAAVPMAGGIGLRPGSTLGRYVIAGVLGVGGMGIVYEAEQERPHRRVALKVIRPGFADADLLRRFEFEAEMLGRLQHPGIAQVYEAGTADVGAGAGLQPYYAMELVRGRPLADYCAAERCDIRSRLELIARVCDAVDHAHQRGVIHRDLKPANIMVEDGGQPKVLDFGVARLAGAEQRRTIISTSAGQIVGTLAYMSPEQVGADSSRVDTRTDVYALGVVMYELLTGRLPHDLTKAGIPEAVRMVAEQDPRPAREVVPALKGDVDTIIARAMDKDRTRRYQSARELGQEIRRHLEGRPIEARRDSIVYVVGKQVRRHRVLVGAGAAILLLLAASAVVFGILAAHNAVLAQQREDQRVMAVAAQQTAAAELSASRIAGARLLTSSGTPTAAESILWREYLEHPRDPQPRWALREFYTRVPCLAARGSGYSMSQALAVTNSGLRAAWSDGRHAFIVAPADLSAPGTTLIGADEGPQTADFDPTGRWLAVGYFGGSMQVFDTRDQVIFRHVQVCDRKVMQVRFAPDGRHLAGVGADGMVRVWDFPAMKLLATLGKDGATCAGFTHDGAGIVFQEQANGPVVVRGLTPDGAGEATASVPVNGSVYAMVATRAGDQVMMAVRSEKDERVFTLVAFDPKEPTDVQRWATNLAIVESMDECDDGETMLVSDGSLTLWSLRTGRLVRTLLRDETSYFVGRLVRQTGEDDRGAGAGPRVIVVSRDHDVRLWDFTPGRWVRHLAGGGACTSVSFSRDGAVLAVGTQRAAVDGSAPTTGVAAFYRAASGALMTRVERPQRTTPALVRFSPCGRWLATGCGETIWVQKADTGEEVLRHKVGPMESMAFDDEGEWLAATGREGRLNVWCTRDWSLVDADRLLATHPSAVAFARPNRLAAVMAYKSLSFINLGESAVPPAVAGVYGEGESWRGVAVSPLGDRVLRITWTRPPQLWDVGLTRVIGRLEGHAQPVTAGRFARSGAIVATASSDGAAALWDTARGLPLARFDCGVGELRDVELSPDEGLLAACGERGAVLIDLRGLDGPLAGIGEWKHEFLLRQVQGEGQEAAWAPPDLDGLMVRATAGVEERPLAPWLSAGSAAARAESAVTR